MNFFGDHNGNFQWASVAAGVALLSVFLQIILQIYNNKRNIDANLKAKSRIEWIQSVRRLSADYIKIAYEYKIMLGEYRGGEGYIEENKIGKDVKIKIDEKWSGFLYTYSLLLLYFQSGRKSDDYNKVTNDQIIESIQKLKDETEGLHRKIGIEELKSFESNGVFPFRDKMRLYLKGEWDRAKSGK